ncbi:MAG: hypothetical protein ACT4QE_19665, partial [Anaerolineales bacterium]
KPGAAARSTWACCANTSMPLIAAASAALLGRVAQSQKFVAVIRKLDPVLSLATLDNLIVMRRPEDFARLAAGMRTAGLPEQREELRFATVLGWARLC